MEHRRLAFFLPNAFTAFNLALGHAAVVFAINGEFYKASLSIFLGAVFDSVDGRLARLLGTSSRFGEQFDSLSDLISFCMAPSLVFYLKFLSDSGRLGLLVSLLFVLCGALRLARFNANTAQVNPNYFQGLPSPGAALCVIGLVMAAPELGLPNGRWYAVFLASVALLMVSNIPFPSFKKSDFIQRHRRPILLLGLVVGGSMFLYEEVTIFTYSVLYVAGSVGNFLIRRKSIKADLYNYEDPSDDE